MVLVARNPCKHHLWYIFSPHCPRTPSISTAFSRNQATLRPRPNRRTRSACCWPPQKSRDVGFRGQSSAQSCFRSPTKLCANKSRNLNISESSASASAATLFASWALVPTTKSLPPGLRNSQVPSVAPSGRGHRESKGLRPALRHHLACPACVMPGAGTGRGTGNRGGGGLEIGVAPHTT